MHVCSKLQHTDNQRDAPKQLALPNAHKQHRLQNPAFFTPNKYLSRRCDASFVQHHCLYLAASRCAAVAPLLPRGSQGYHHCAQIKSHGWTFYSLLPKIPCRDFQDAAVPDPARTPGKMLTQKLEKSTDFFSLYWHSILKISVPTDLEWGVLSFLLPVLRTSPPPHSFFQLLVSDQKQFADSTEDRVTKQQRQGKVKKKKKKAQNDQTAFARSFICRTSR